MAHLIIINGLLCLWTGTVREGTLEHQRANIKRIPRYNTGMARCRVSFTDHDGIPHAVEVHAESLYEAVAMAVAEFRSDGLTEAPGPMTEFTVSIQRPAIEHRIRLHQVSKWADRSTTEGPAGITRRQRVKVLLGQNPNRP